MSANEQTINPDSTLSSSEIISTQVTKEPAPIIEMPEEINYEGIAQRYMNKIKHLEISIEQNRKRGKTICNEFFQAIQATEVLAFDFLFAEYLIGAATHQQLYAYIDSCIRPQFNIISGDPRDIDAAADHIKGVQNQIQSSVQSLLRHDQKRVEPPKRVQDIIISLNEQNQKLESEYQRGIENLQNEAKTAPPLVINYEIPAPEKEAGEINPEFTEWMTQILKPGATSVDPETAELRALFGTVIHRFQMIQKMKQKIATMKSTAMSTRNLKHTDCDPAAIYSSPFFRAVQNNCVFLGKTLDGIRSLQIMIPSCEEAIKRCQMRLDGLNEKCQKSIREMEKHTENLRIGIAKNQKEIEEKSAAFRQYADALSFDKHQLDFEEKKQKTKALDHQIEQLLVQKINTSTDDDQKTKFQSQLKDLKSLRDLRENIVTKVSTDTLKIIKEKIDLENQLYHTAAAYCREVEMKRLQTKEIDDLADYEKCLNKVKDLLNVEEITRWCSKLEEVSTQFSTTIQAQKKIISEFDPFLQANEEDNNDIENLQIQVDELIQTNRQLAETEIALNTKIDEAEEELFQIMQELETYREWMDPSEEQINDKEIENSLVCPVCKARHRDTFISSCGHPICHGCYEQSHNIHKCPICQKSYTDDEIIPMIFT